MLTIKVFVNGRPISEAKAQNVSGLAVISDYECSSLEIAGPFTTADDFVTQFKIEKHDREQTCWALVEKIAAEISCRTPHREASAVPGDRTSANEQSVER